MTRPGEAQILLRTMLSAGPQEEVGEACYLWKFSHKKGYPVIWSLNGGHQCERVHVLVCERFHGPKPSPKHEVAHSCGNSMCCNKRHVRWATHKENIDDKLVHGTHQTGEKHPRARLTAALVQEIRERYATGAAQTAIAVEYGISQTHVSDIVTRKSWRFLT